mmetsp:Transcript_10205/g.30880  ORF Transcript_10205/g.30880 Transcript_10205/m.30880 type:complete len:84 (-) Transcript_10205:494-745(-)
MSGHHGAGPGGLLSGSGGGGLRRPSSARRRSLIFAALACCCRPLAGHDKANFCSVGIGAVLLRDTTKPIFAALAMLVSSSRGT